MVVAVVAVAKAISWLNGGIALHFLVRSLGGGNRIGIRETEQVRNDKGLG